MAKTEERNTSRRLRRKGESLSEIAKKLNVSKSSVSLWCSDVVLTKEQIKKLNEREAKGSYEGRVKGALANKRKKMIRKEVARKDVEKILETTKGKRRDLLLLGAGIYLGEGSKSHGRVKINNSDARIIKLMIRWFQEIWNVDDSRFKASLSVNEFYENKQEEMKKYWIKETGFSQKQFLKTTVIRVKNRKRYDYYPNYYGTLTISIKEPVDLYYRVLALIDIVS